jgi:tRNA dimethylallyltransferase
MKKLIVIVGPTGIGKTAFAIKVSKHFNGEIVGADSMQLYKHMAIGTAKPNEQEQKQIRHHMVDFLDPKDVFDAGKYMHLADQAIDKIISRQKIPVITGGTGLYVRALLNGLFRSSTICQKTLDQLSQAVKKNGSDAVHQQLAECDPDAAKKIHPNDTFRVIRALEVFLTTGKKISERQNQHDFKLMRYPSIKIGLYMDREKLYQRINQRVDLMIEQGLLDEVISLIENGYPLTLKSMQSIGYKQMGMYINGDVSFEEAVRLIKRDTRRYAKRQMTWFRKEPDVHWVRPDQYADVEPKIKQFLT